MVEIEINGGLTVIDAVHSGSSNFQVHLASSTDDRHALFVNEIGEYAGESARVLEPGTYSLEVEADGDWWLEVRQPRIPSVEDLPQSLHDTKPRVVGPFEFGGSYTATCSHRGDRNFQVAILPTEGQLDEFVVNEVGSYTGEATFSHTGLGCIGVEAHGEWTLEFE
ncbi:MULTISPECIES: hypothetical protein [Natrialbaceae]|uniref:hypothetical protein n=1 Tax=Natrialbaceae TaxID=1644061 RepID=UPI00207CC266|nr:hypothetical protein [Natronococcus sp. CG52]